MRSRVDAYALRLIEVKGRAKGARTVTLSKNEILTALTSPSNFILAIVEIDGDKSKTIYLKHPFEEKDAPTFAEENKSFNIMKLISKSEIIYQE